MLHKGAALAGDDGASSGLAHYRVVEKRLSCLFSSRIEKGVTFSR